MNKSFRVNATGCSLVDNLYGHVDFSSETYRRLSSRKPGDGGLATGGLVFAEAFAEFAASAGQENGGKGGHGGNAPAAGNPAGGQDSGLSGSPGSPDSGPAETDYPGILKSLTGSPGPDSSNIGGPGIVPVIHAAQVKQNPDILYRFAGVLGRDDNGRRFRERMETAGFPLKDSRESDLPTPSTDVLSDPAYDGGRGERTFINTIGAAGTYTPESLPEDFFDGDFLLFGGTALVPPLHDNLDKLCRRGREAGAFVMVTTVFDFRNEARLQGKPWPLVDDYGNIDLLVTDREEALKISGEASPEAAMNWFLNRGCRGVVVTQGADAVLLGTAQGQNGLNGLVQSAPGGGGAGRFLPPGRRSMPTCRYADEVVAGLTKKRDTTGCGDNFVGGMVDSLAHQMAAMAAEKSGGPAGGDRLNLEEAVISGIAAGSVALTCLGGVYYEEKPGEKFKAMKPYFDAYRRELMEQKK
jgi:sugar/nucleoside kinase (ribokinase family)